MRSPAFSAPPAAFVSASLEIAHSLPTPNHTLRSDTTLLVPSCEARYIHPASSLVSSQWLHEGEKYTIVHAIGYYGHARTRFTSP
jgi:hypothetical protein